MVQTVAISIRKQEESKENAYEMMKNNNPSIIPRNHRVEEALEAAVTNGDYSVMEKLLEALANPYAYSTIKKNTAFHLRLRIVLIVLLWDLMV